MAPPAPPWSLPLPARPPLFLPDQPPGFFKAAEKQEEVVGRGGRVGEVTCQAGCGTGEAGSHGPPPSAAGLGVNSLSL